MQGTNLPIYGKLKTRTQAAPRNRCWVQNRITGATHCVDNENCCGSSRFSFIALWRRGKPFSHVFFPAQTKTPERWPPAEERTRRCLARPIAVENCRWQTKINGSAFTFSLVTVSADPNLFISIHHLCAIHFFTKFFMIDAIWSASAFLSPRHEMEFTHFRSSEMCIFFYLYLELVFM